MEIKTKYQYTYFIYPYIVAEKKFEKYLEKLLNNKNCKLKFFESEKDWDLYTYFLPKVRNYVFSNFEYNKSKINKLKEFDSSMQATLLAKNSCNIFEYNIDKDIQGKTNRKDGIFFSIRKIELICFNTGICFLTIKTTLDEDTTLEDLCNFNYKFKDINSSLSKLKDFENIKIQTDSFKDIQGIPQLIKDITGNPMDARKLNIDTEKFITYSYACIGQESWNDKSKEDILEKEFYRFANVQPADSPVNYNKGELDYEMQLSKNIKFGFSKTGTVLLTSDINTDNFTKVPHKFENEYLYNYIFELFKKITLNKINREFETENKFKKSKAKFIDFTMKIWIEEITNEETGNMLSERWSEKLGFKEIYSEVKQKYDILYKNANIEKTAKSNKWIAIILAVLVLINFINCLTIMQK